MRNFLLLLSVFFYFSSELNAQSLSSFPYSTNISIEGEREKVVGTFLNKKTDEEKFEFIKDYIEKPEDYIQFISTMRNGYINGRKLNEESIINTSFIVLKLSDKLNTSSWSKEYIYDFVDINYITDIKHIENFIKIFKNNKLLNTRMIFFNSSTRSYIKDLLNKQDTETIIKVMSLYNDSDYKLYIFDIIKSDIESEIYKVQLKSINKKRFDYSEIIPPYDKTVYEVINYLKQNNINHKIRNDKSLTTAYTVFANPDVFNLFSKDTQNIITNFFMFDEETLKDVKERTEPHYNFKSLKGYLEFVAYSQYNWIFAALIILYIFLESRKIILTRLYNKEKNELILSSRDFFYENKIEKNEILPIKLIIDKYKLYNSLVENYDKLYIKSLKLGLYNTANKNKLTSLKNEITSLKKEIEILKEELINLEEKFQTKELQNLINIKTRIEKLKDSTTFGYILDSIIKVQNEINELLENYTDDKFSDSKIKEIESFIQKIEEQVNESSIYLEEYNRLVELKSPYDILGVDEKDDISVIKKKWKELCLKYHSDKNIDKPKYIKDIFEETIKIINNAWDIISKQNKKEI